MDVDAWLRTRHTIHKTRRQLLTMILVGLVAIGVLVLVG